MKLAHDLEHDLEHTIPPVGGPDSQWLFREMTVRALALTDPRPQQRVLDLASGMGQDTAALAAMQRAATATQDKTGGAGRGTIWGLEPSRRMMRWAQSRLEPAHAGRVRWIRALAEELPFADASFDTVLCKGALDHFMAPGQALDEIGRILRPGGRLVLALANYDSLSCRLGCGMARLGLARPRPGDAHAWFDPPPDHLTRFAYAGIQALLADGRHGPWRRVTIFGVSLLWGLPPWSRLLARLPRGAAWRLAALAGRVGNRLPALADVVIAVAVKH